MDFLTVLRPIRYPNHWFMGTATAKRQVVLRHTGLACADEHLEKTLRASEAKLPASVVIGRDGVPLQCFASRYWGRHLGVRAKTLADQGFHDAGQRGEYLNQSSVAVELSAAGGLLFYRGTWYVPKRDPTCGKLSPDLGRPVNRGDVQAYPDGYQGFDGYERYTEAQLATLADALHHWAEEWGIPLAYDPASWQGCREALAGQPGIWPYQAFQPASPLLHPQPDLLTCLQDVCS